MDNKGVKLKSEGALVMQMSFMPVEKNEYRNFYFDDTYYNSADFKIENYLSLVGSNEIYEPSIGNFVPYAIVFNGADYIFYRNGVKIDSFSYVGNDINGVSLPEFECNDFGIIVNDSVIRFETKVVTKSQNTKNIGIFI